MILAGQLLIDNGSGKCRLAPGFVRTDGEVIAEVVEGDIPTAPDFGGHQALIAPGFIDAHLHLPQFDMMGAHGMPLLRWLAEVTFPAEMKWASVDYALNMTQRVIDQLVSVGTTGICAYATVHHESAAAAMRLVQQSGMRGVVGQVLMDRNAPDELCVAANQLIEEAEHLCELFPAHQRISAAITPRFAISCSEELLAAAGRLAAEKETMIQSHVAETLNECDVVRELFGGNSYVEVYEQAGLLTERSVFGHGIHLNSRDRRTLRAKGATIAHCPTANSFLRSGAMNRFDLTRDKVQIAIGSDIGAGYERSMVRVARAMIETACAVSDSFPDAATAWHAITAGNADVLGWKDAGRLQAGNAADLLVIEPSIDWQSGSVDPLSMLMFAWDDRWLKQTVLRGRASA
ncbi:MAG: amidohydrolase family protein [Rubripirellula sp.]